MLVHIEMSDIKSKGLYFFSSERTKQVSSVDAATTPNAVVRASSSVFRSFLSSPLSTIFKTYYVNGQISSKITGKTIPYFSGKKIKCYF